MAAMGLSEIDHMEDVDTVPYAASEPDEMEVLKAHLPYDEESGTFALCIGDED